MFGREERIVLEEAHMPAEVLTYVLGVLVLVIAFVMGAIGLMGVFGAVRFAGCLHCTRLTLRAADSQAICRRCRRLLREIDVLPGATPTRVAALPVGRHRLHVHLPVPHVGFPHSGS
jgi:hypothetical protein